MKVVCSVLSDSGAEWKEMSGKVRTLIVCLRRGKAYTSTEKLWPLNRGTFLETCYGIHTFS